MFRRDRLSPGGGVLLAVHSSITCVEIKIKTDCEILSVDLCSSGKSVRVIIAYIPSVHDKNYVRNLFKEISNLRINAENVLI